MANKHKTYAELFTAIADSIRTKTGTEESIIADNFPEEISKISGNVLTDYEQLINYTMLYNEGDECVDVTGGWDASGYSFSTFTINNATENTDSIYVTTTDSALSASGTVNAVDMSEYTGMYFDISVTSINSQNQGVLYYVLDSKTVPSAPPIYGERHSLGKYIEHLDISNKTDLGYVFFTAYGNGSSAYFRHLWMVKADDYITLCSKAGITSTPSSLSELISNTTALSAIFANEDAMNFMAKQCTGDLMVSILNDATARGLLKNSPYLPYVVGNEHWIKFIMMIPDADELLNVTMLYDGSLGESGLSGANACPDITGGFVTHYDSSKDQSNNNCDFNADSIYLRSHYTSRKSARSINKIDLSGYTKLFARFDYTHSSNDMTYLRLGLHENATSTASSGNTDIPSIVYGAKASSSDGVVSGENTKVFDITDDSTSMYFGMIVTSGSSTTTTANIYGAALLKPDDYSTLCNKIGILAPDSLDALLEDSTSISMLMNNPKAIDYLVGCTGDLMIGILQSEAAISSASEYAKKVLYAHPIWRKFIDMLGVDLIPAPEEYEQIVNYTMLYDEGDECEEITGGWQAMNTSTSYTKVGTLTKNDSNMVYTVSGGSTEAGIGTVSTISLSEYNTFGVLGLYTNLTAADCGLLTIAKGVSAGLHQYERISTSTSITNPTIMLMTFNDVYKTGHPVYMCTYGGTIQMSKAFILKSDDIPTLCTKAGVGYPSDLATLIADTTSLSTIFNNEDAVRFMVAQCTGDFMVSVLSNEAAVEALKASPYLNLVVANPHWAKFAMMIPNVSGIFGFTMLYDEGDECTDVTGGWKQGDEISTGGSVNKNTDNLYVRSNNGTSDTTTYANAAYETQNYLEREGYLGMAAQATVTEKSSNSIGGHLIFNPTSTAWGRHHVVDETFNSVETKAIKCVNFADGFDNGTQFESSGRVGIVARNGNCQIYCYAVWLYKEDDWVGLCTKFGITVPLTAKELANSSQAMSIIMNDEKAIKYLMGCTGEFMIRVLTSTTAVAAIVNSAVATQYLTSHPAWAKFIAMSPTCVDAGLDLLV